MKIKKAIIPAGGLGTRFLPATKAQPKEMLPIVDKPTIQYIVEEAVNSGIEDILIISGRNKRAIEDHFDRSVELEFALSQKGNDELLKSVQDISNLANIHYIRQKEPLGLGHAVLCARKFIRDEPFAVLLGDDIITSETPCIKQLMNVYSQTGKSVIGVKEIDTINLHKYGVIDPKIKFGDKFIEIEGMVEKPKDIFPSNLAVMGRYILTPEIFPLLERLEPGNGAEIQLTDALNQLSKLETVIAYPFLGERFDVGDKLEYLKATIQFALKRKDLSKEFELYLVDIVNQIKVFN
ncbi:UTP--glucose-1-phosphate uridylyltransferase [Paenibacillus konkukensis]|uniref:UTP--glucose-1-phosphate uridylyltransferase n=1 Tax=Paenibacillus konkukensis TaxID=2020716 RepID=A0ABY4RP33_9BACL|nr:UTP--glucose-1-phosphate uridylyltransferase GalU [Paenibacillus konkukensis]UQZ83955.1 UTP--glucose-1-phosphate uridylyltransferase [Paenibacillus konkukensis]